LGKVVVVVYVTKLEPKEFAAPFAMIAVLIVRKVWVGPPLGNVFRLASKDEVDGVGNLISFCLFLVLGRGRIAGEGK